MPRVDAAEDNIKVPMSARKKTWWSTYNEAVWEGNFRVLAHACGLLLLEPYGLPEKKRFWASMKDLQVYVTKEHK